MLGTTSPTWPEIKLHSEEIDGRNSINEDLWHLDDATVSDVPFEPEQNIVPALGYVVSFVAEEQLHTRCI